MFNNENNTNHGNILLVANYASDVGYAWWLMENFWIQIADLFSQQGRKVFLMYPVVNTVPSEVSKSSIIIVEHDFSDIKHLDKRI